ncbi:MAG TPA: YkgJ family cysteine cluster protein, partial [Kofleriaceae bacterium]|nr:YkgJ family cysteine cluster protein [Kofleriaceae bacterium]
TAPTAPTAPTASTDPPALWLAVAPPPPPHPTGLPVGDAAFSGATCGACAWRHDHRGAARCRQAAAKVEPAWPACERYEPALDCQDCGACCRAAYHSVEVARRDPAVKAHPELVVDRGTYLEIRRDGDRCAALHGGTADAPRYHCIIYSDRPRTCRDFTLGSDHCLTARRRVGLSL